MPYSVGSPIVSANIVTGDTATAVAVGDSVTIVEARGASEREVSGTVLAFELGNKPFYGKRAREIYDGVPTSEYSNPVATMIQNASDCMEINAILVEVPGTEGSDDQEATPATHVRVNVGRIKSITADQGGSGESADEDSGTEEDDTAGA